MKRVKEDFEFSDLTQSMASEIGHARRKEMRVYEEAARELGYESLAALDDAGLVLTIGTGGLEVYEAEGKARRKED